MTTPELTEYIKAQRGFNVAKEAIVAALSSVGWQNTDIDEAFALLGTDAPRAVAGTLATPEFFGHERDGVTYMEERSMKEKVPEKQGNLRVRFPEGLVVMPQPAQNAFAKEGGIPMRPAEGPVGQKKAALRGLVNALIILTILAVLSAVVLYLLGYLDPSHLLNLSLF